ncbi:hypothetical protein JCM10213_000267 [Rhodosporidiobolus nylandii]
MTNKKNKQTKPERAYFAKHLVVDSAPLFEAPLSSLRGLARSFWVAPDVIAEMRDRRHRNIMEEARLQLPADTLVEGQEPDELTRLKEGFEVREPTAEAVAKITAFARKTGDIAVLSTADIRVLALCLTLELEENGSWRVRDHPGQVLTGPPQPEAEEKKEEEVEGKGKAAAKEGEELAQSVEKLSVVEESTKGEQIPVVEEQPIASTSSLPPPIPATSDSAAATSSSSNTPASTDAASTTPAPQSEPAPSPSPAPEADDGDDSDAESDASGGSWITPENVLEHKVRDLGLFAAPDADSPDAPSTSSAAASSSSVAAPAPRPRTIMKAAVLTGDYAMQNVALQMGLNVLGSGGKRVKEVRTWVLRCHACFKLCKNPDKRFCPSCGGATLLRTSITYVPATPQNPQGYILHLKANYNYRLRGTQYSLPNPKMGRAGGAQSEIVTREDQKEWIRGVKSAEVRREKEQRALTKQLLDDEEKRKAGLEVSSSTSAAWFDQTGSLEAQMMGIGGGKGGIENPKGRRRGGKNGAGGEVRLDKSGLPVIGMGRRNVNEARRRK